MEDDNKIYITNSSDLPEVTVTAPRKYFVGYDENVNPVYTTDRTLSQDYLQSQIPVGNAEQKRKQWAFENVGANGQTKPGIQGDAKDISRLVTAGIGSTLAPIAVAPVARAVFPAVKTLASAGRITWNAVKPGGTIPNWLYRQTFTPQGTLTSGATELLGSTVAGEGLNEILNQKSKSGDWTEDVDHKYFHGDIGNTIGEEGRNMFLTAPLYGTYNAGKSMADKIKNVKLFDILPYNVFDNIGPAISKARRFLASDPTKPYKEPFSVRRKLVSNMPRQDIPDVTLQKGITPNFHGDGLQLMKSRARQSEFDPGFFTLDRSNDTETFKAIRDVPVRTHTSLCLAYGDLKNQNNKILKILPYYFKINYEPGVFSKIGMPFILINKRHLKSLGLNDINNVLSHEYNHAIWDRFHISKNPSDHGFFIGSMPTDIQKYMYDLNETAARGTQIKNYFGIADNTEVTPDMLKYAAKHYVEDTGMDNNMNLFFRTIKDWDKAAKFINTYSFKQGGKINNE